MLTSNIFIYTSWVIYHNSLTSVFLRPPHPWLEDKGDLNLIDNFKVMLFINDSWVFSRDGIMISEVKLQEGWINM